LLADHEIDISHEPEESIEWAIDDLKGSYTDFTFQALVRDAATAMHAAATHEKPALIAEVADAFVELAQSVERAATAVDLREAAEHRIEAFNDRAMNRGQVQGLGFGEEKVDTYTGGVRPGELAVLAAGPKVGKSWMLAHIAYNHWKVGNPTTLFSLEMSVEEMMERIAVLATNIDARAWQQGISTPSEVATVTEWVEWVKNENDVPLWIMQPSMERATVEHIVRDSVVRGTSALIIDQLSHITLDEKDLKRSLSEQVGNTTHKLRKMISDGRTQVPCLLAHQITREGLASADRTGKLEMRNLAGSAVVERTADFVFGLYQSEDQRHARLATLQVLAARREAPKAWEMEWNLGTGGIAVEREVSLPS
jgi:replicative DNA helicase